VAGHNWSRFSVDALLMAYRFGTGGWAQPGWRGVAEDHTCIQSRQMNQRKGLSRM